MEVNLSRFFQFNLGKLLLLFLNDLILISNISITLLDEAKLKVNFKNV